MCALSLLFPSALDADYAGCGAAPGRERCWSAAANTTRTNKHRTGFTLRLMNVVAWPSLAPPPTGTTRITRCPVPDSSLFTYYTFYVCPFEAQVIVDTLFDSDVGPGYRRHRPASLLC